MNARRRKRLPLFAIFGICHRRNPKSGRKTLGAITRPKLTTRSIPENCGDRKGFSKRCLSFRCSPENRATSSEMTPLMEETVGRRTVDTISVGLLRRTWVVKGSKTTPLSKAPLSILAKAGLLEGIVQILPLNDVQTKRLSQMASHGPRKLIRGRRSLRST